MTNGRTLALLRLGAAQLAAMLRSDGGKRAILAAIRKSRARGIAVTKPARGWQKAVTDAGALHPHLIVTVVAPASWWLARISDRSRAAPGELKGRSTAPELQFAVIAVPTSSAEWTAWRAVRQRLAVAPTTLRLALEHETPCWLGGWKADFSVRWVGAQAQPAWQEGCEPCGARVLCGGPSAGSLVAPLQAAQSNQFDAEERELAGDGELGVEIVVRADDRERHFFARSGALSSLEIQQALARGQLYLDVSDSARLTDFAAQTRLLERQPNGVWVPRAGDPFAVEERELLGEIAQLRGVVVDIGAGPVRYLKSLAAAVDRGQIRYVAVEPDRSHIAASQPALPGGVWIQGVGESVPVATGAADAVMMLRSYNHLRDPAAAIAEAARVVAPGGRLIAVDNVVFGLCRSREQLDRARSISVEATPFEHYRNASGAEAARAIAADGRWRIDRCEDVGPGTANQWMVTATRAEGP